MDFLSPFVFVGRLTLDLLAGIGRFTAFAGQALWAIASPRYHPRQLGQQFVEMCFFSLPVVGMTGLFTGMVLALQGDAALSRLAADQAVPQLVSVSLLRELGPVVAGLMIAGRVGSSISAELATMRVAEQVDALKTMSIDPWRYLIAPRVLGAVLALPLLVLVANVIGIGGGFLVAVGQLGFAPSAFVDAALAALRVEDWVISMTKAVAFGAIVGLLGCYMGFYAQGGAQGVGRATTNAVVASSILLLIANLLITLAFFELGGQG